MSFVHFVQGKHYICVPSRVRDCHPMEKLGRVFVEILFVAFIVIYNGFILALTRHDQDALLANPIHDLVIPFQFTYISLPLSNILSVTELMLPVEAQKPLQRRIRHETIQISQSVKEFRGTIHRE